MSDKRSEERGVDADFPFDSFCERFRYEFVSLIARSTGSWKSVRRLPEDKRRGCVIRVECC